MADDQGGAAHAFLYEKDSDMSWRVRLTQRSLWLIIGVAIVVANITPSKAAEHRLFSPQYDLSIRDAALPTKRGGPLPYSATRTNATWSLVAWGIPGGALPPFSETKGEAETVFSSRAASASVVIKQQTNGQAEYQLSQNGAILPCQTADGHPAEFDLFLHPNDKADAYEQSGYTTAPEFKDGLDALSTLTLQTVLGFAFKPVRRTEECGVASGNAVAGFILRNPSAKQTLFYDVVLASACGKQPAKRQAHCEQYLAKPWSMYFSRKTPFGVDDPAPLMGMAFLRNGESRTIKMNVLPALLAAIARSPDGMDRDPSHWRLQGFLNGQVIYGGMEITTTWSHLAIMAERK